MSNAQSACELCAPGAATSPAGSRCDTCREKGDLVGAVVWSFVTEHVRNAGQSERVIFMLAGLPAMFLEGIARKAPGDGRLIEGRGLCIALNPAAATNLDIQPPANASEESAVHWRHSTVADVIVFAPSDAEREGIGAGLGPLARIDEQAVVGHLPAWLDILNETGGAHAYMRRALEGLRSSQIFIGLEMWVDFILAIKAQGFALPVHLRLQAAAPALQIPRDGITKLPAYRTDGGPPPPQRDFYAAFQAAESEVRVYAGMITPQQEPVDIEAVRDAINGFEHGDEPETVAALDIVRRLIDDGPNIRPGEWRDSQREFCEGVSWERIGVHLFASGRRTRRRSLGEETLSFIEGNHADDVTPEDRKLLDSLKDSIPREPRDEELEFFARWQEKINHPDIIRIFKAWQRRLFFREVMGHDLLSAFSKGFEALIVAGADTLATMDDPRVLVRTTQHNKALFWEKLDIDVQRLFRFELRSLQGIFSDRVRWDLDACFEHDARESSNTNDSRMVDLELYLVEASDAADLAGTKTPPRSAPRVKATWQPGLKPKSEPISLALADDIEALATAARNDAGLFRDQRFAPRASSDQSRVASTTLSDTNSFSDVAQAQDGRTFDTTVLTKDDLLATLRETVSALTASRSLDAESAAAITAALDTFEGAYRSAILAIDQDPGAGFASETVDDQANAFGGLCRACRLHAKGERAQAEIRPVVARLGVVLSEGSDPMAILAAWHPFRLSERRAKIRDLAGFVDSVLGSPTARNADLTIAFHERGMLTERWVFPETVLVDDTTMISVEDVGGYSLMVPADCVARSQEALENSTPLAAAKFIEGVNQYLDVHPHEATNLSAAIYDSESLTLPKEIARLLAQRIHRDPSLRCDLVITHHDQGRLRQIYSDQNMRLDVENISDTAKGFLSRLRIDVKPNRSTDGQDDAIRDLDLVFLHDAVSHHAKPQWDLERGGAEGLDTRFDLDTARIPRRRLADADAPGAGVYLTVPRPPRTVAEYHDLLYEIDKSAFLAEDHHGVLIQHIRFDDPQVQEMIERAHDLGEWVVSHDKVCSRALLNRCGVQIIRDISVPGSDGRVIISAGKIDERLRRKVGEELAEACGIDGPTASRLGSVVLKDIVQISGQKILSAARFANASREMIGLSLMRAHLEASLPADRPATASPIWISLDDYRGWITTGTGKIADVVGVTILDTGSRFDLLIQVGEAKFVSMDHEMAESGDARKQVRDTVDILARMFIDNEDPISRRAWCARLVELLVNRDGLSDRLPDAQRRTAFVESLRAGEVAFRISGEAVVCLHDDHDTSPRQERDPDRPHLRHHALPTPVIRQTLVAIAEGGVPERGELRDVRWYAGGERQPPAPTPPDDHATPEPEARAPEPAPEPPTAESTQAEQVRHPPDPEPGPPGGHDLPANTASDPEGDAEPPPDAPAEDRERPRFIPGPVHAILQDMEGREEGTISDPESIAWAEQICEQAQRALSHFGMQARFAEPRYRLTPNVALVTFQGHETLTVDKVSRRTGELLTTHGIEVVNIMPGPRQISLSIKRENRAKVPLASTWLQAPWPDEDPGDLTSFLLGAQENNERLLFLNIGGPFAGYEEHGPHTLIAGETGSGKGVLTQGLLMQLIAFNDPERAELILIDPKKGVDFAWLDDTPHMKRPIITEMPDAERVFLELVAEMDKRYETFSQARVQNIAQYNDKAAPGERMSRIFLVHDEIGEWMAREKDYAEMVLSAVSSLGMKARAAGIHLVLITQRADADAVPTRLRDNMGNRFCLKVQNATGSRMVLNTGGAERLLGRGHMACVLANENPPPGQEYFVVQVPFAAIEDMERLAEAAKGHWRKHRT